MASTAKQLKFITGTGGTLDYMVVLENEYLALGIKPVTQPVSTKLGPKGMYIGIRLRAASKLEPNKIVSMGDKAVVGMLTKKSWGDAFPTIEWEKADEDRASTQISICTLLQPWQGDEVLAMLEEEHVPEKFLAWIDAHSVDFAEWVGEHEEMVAWMHKRYKEMIGSLAEVFLPLPGTASIMEPDYLPKIGEKFGSQLQTAFQAQQAAKAKGSKPKLSLIADNTPADFGDHEEGEEE